VWEFLYVDPDKTAVVEENLDRRCEELDVSDDAARTILYAIPPRVRG
jgi:ABC-type Zn uptake system ZnuABC Zn-binding protein ZnuA